MKVWLIYPIEWLCKLPSGDGNNRIEFRREWISDIIPSRGDTINFSSDLAGAKIDSREFLIGNDGVVEEVELHIILSRNTVPEPIEEIKDWISEGWVLDYADTYDRAYDRFVTPRPLPTATPSPFQGVLQKIRDTESPDSP